MAARLAGGWCSLLPPPPLLLLGPVPACFAACPAHTCGHHSATHLSAEEPHSSCQHHHTVKATAVCRGCKRFCVFSACCGKSCDPEPRVLCASFSQLTCCFRGRCRAALPTAACTLCLHPHAAAAAQPTGCQEGTNIDVVLALIQQHASLAAAAAACQAGKWADRLRLTEPTGRLQAEGPRRHATAEAAALVVGGLCLRMLDVVRLTSAAGTPAAAHERADGTPPCLLLSLLHSPGRVPA